MRGTISLEAETLGPLSIAVDEPIITWKGKKLPGWPIRVLTLLRLMIEFPMFSPDELAAMMGYNVHTLQVRLSEARQLLKVARLPIQIIGNTDDSMRILNYHLVLLESPWIENRTAADIDRSKGFPSMAPEKRRA